MPPILARLLAPVAATLVAGTAAAFEPGVVFTEAGKFDKSFNEAAFAGAIAYRQNTGGSFIELAAERPDTYVQTITAVAEEADLVVAVGFAFGEAMTEVAATFPNKRFTIVDFVIDAPNVQSIVFSEHEGSYLAGIMAAKASRTGTIGFVGGLDFPLIRKFLAGYRAGALSVRPDTRVMVGFAGTFADPFAGSEVAARQLAGGADVLFGVAGSTGLGVYLAAHAAGVQAVGVDSNQNYLFPGTMLTSMLKRVDLAVETAFTGGRDGSWTPALLVLGLAEGGVDVAIDGYNDATVTADMRNALEAARTGIVGGRIDVPETAP